ncbi:hypothetical protein ACQKP0_14470 [Heyndrickxia sp. NPDC080065]|uniref:hypothetical protein n=1 Tax=Heyndrickxia sp. NPDC080065 TaxID=3390568 RepID=UPI003D04BEA7
MKTNKVLELRCTNPNCKTWFQSPFFQGNVDHFDVNAFKGLKSQCPLCGKMVQGSIKNVRIRPVGDNDRFGKIS